MSSLAIDSLDKSPVTANRTPLGFHVCADSEAWLLSSQRQRRGRLIWATWIHENKTLAFYKGIGLNSHNLTPIWLEWVMLGGF